MSLLLLFSEAKQVPVIPVYALRTSGGVSTISTSGGQANLQTQGGRPTINTRGPIG